MGGKRLELASLYSVGTGIYGFFFFISTQPNQRLNAFSGIEPAGKRRKVSESSTLYDVFINHRGPDVKATLATELYKSLEQLGIRAFLDSEEKELGNSFPSTIETAIRSAKVHIAIFSKRYAESAWCLDELVLMLESTGQNYPVFYQVKPSDLRHIEKGAYAQAFLEHKNKGRYDDKKINEWMEALRSLSLIAGEEFYSEGDCQKVVAAAQKEVQRNTYLHVADNPVGLNNLVEDFQKQCFDEHVQDLEGKHKAQVVDISGMGGVGKTTLAKELFNRKSSNYCTASFLFDVREVSARSQLPSLQLKLLQDLFDDRRPSFTSSEEGTSRHKDCLRRTTNLNSLIVVDDIDYVDQLNALSVMDISNKSGNNLVIVTTRNVGVLITAEITCSYNLKGMGSNDATELFCWHAFRQAGPLDGYEVLVKDFVDVCGGLPLSLQVLGRHVFYRDHNYWSLELMKVRKALPGDVKQRLRISFDALDDEEKQVFMDVACFFLGKPKRMAERICEGSYSNAQHALVTLKDRCLVEEKKKFSILNNQTEIVLRMHEHLRDLGREMARNFISPHRLWHPRDLKSLELKGLKTILTETNARCFHSIFDESMGSQVTFFLGHSDFSVESSASVLWLQLEGSSTELSSIPSWIPLQELRCLEIKRGQLKTLWENRTQAPSHLKELLIFQTSLKEIPKLLGISDSLENVFLDAQDLPIQGLSLLDSLSMNLSSIRLSFSRLEGEQASDKRERTFCKSLVIVNFKFNGEVDWNNGGISTSVKAPVSGLEKLEISYDKFLSKNLICGIHYPRLKFIKLDAIENLMEVNLTSVKTLNCLVITRCLKIKRIIIDRLSCMENMEVHACKQLQSITLPSILFSLSLQNCRNLQRVSGTGDLIELKRLTISKCLKLEELPSLSKVRCMENIEVHTCEKLQSITLPTTLFSLSLQNCKNLQRVSGTGDRMELKNLTIKKCPELEELQNLFKVSCMENIEVDNCEKLQSITLPTTLFSLSLQNCKNLQRVSGTGDRMELKNLTIKKCPELEELRNLFKVSCMENIEVENCEKLLSITLPMTLFNLCLQNCRNLQRVLGTCELVELKRLTIRKCPKLEELLSLSKVSCMENIEVDTFEKLLSITIPTTLSSLSVQNCRNLQRVSRTGDHMELKKLTVCKCPKLEELPSLSSLSCMVNIEVDTCEKLLSITLPRTLFSLSLQNCRNLQRVSRTGDCMELKRLTICKCPKLEELPSLSSLNSMVNIEVDTCEKLPIITLPTTIFSLSLQNCRNLQRVSGTCDFKQLTELNITECPMLEELPSVSNLSCLKIFQIKNCEEIHLQSIVLPPTLISLFLQSCRYLQRVSGSSDLIKLTELIIGNCPELEELPRLSGVSCMENIEVDTCEKLKSITLPTILSSLSVHSCKNLQSVSRTGDLMELNMLTIKKCPELEELPSLSRVNCMENMEVDTCEKLQRITLPTTLFSLSLQNCKNLQRVSGTGDRMELKKLTIKKCPELEELQCLFEVSCMENIEVDTCEKIQSITLPTTLFSLSVQNCRNLQRLSGTKDLMELKTLTIRKCPQLEELQSLARLGLLKCIMIDSCEKLENIAGIEESTLRVMKLNYCSNTFIRNCIHMLQSLPSSGMYIIGRAVDVAGTIFCLNESLFSDAQVGADSLTDITQGTGDGDVDIDDDDFDEEYDYAVIGCYVVVVDSSTSAEHLNKSLPDYEYNEVPVVGEMREGEWIITRLECCVNRYELFDKTDYVLRMYGMMKKGFRVKMKQGEEWKTVGLLRAIVDRLYLL